jgi:hypothetical protein
VLAANSLPQSIKEALVARRTTATEIPDLWATLRGPSGQWQGSIIEADPGETLRLRVDAGSPTEPLLGVQIIGDNGLSGRAHYYGDNPDWSSVHSQLTPSYLEQHRRYTMNGGATLKTLAGRRFDGPLAGTVMASAPLNGARAHTTIEVRVPKQPGPRPDGRHFFYAIVYAGRSSFPARAWTGPLLTTPGTNHHDGDAGSNGGAAGGHGSGGEHSSAMQPHGFGTHLTAMATFGTPAGGASATPRIGGCGCRA